MKSAKISFLDSNLTNSSLTLCKMLLHRLVLNWTPQFCFAVAYIHSVPAKQYIQTHLWLCYITYSYLTPTLSQSRAQLMPRRRGLVSPRAYERSGAKERQTTVHLLAPSSVEFGASKTCLIRQLHVAVVTAGGLLRIHSSHGSFLKVPVQVQAECCIRWVELLA